MTEIFIAGVGMTRFGPQPGESVNSLSNRAIRQCLKDAGAELNQVGIVFYSNAVQDLIASRRGLTGQTASQGTGFEGLPVVNVENGCASASTALWQARNHLLTGQDDLVLALGTEKMVFNDVALSERVRNVRSHTELCCAHMARFGTTQRQLAVIAAKNHTNSVYNQKCHYNHAFTVEEILSARTLYYPFTAPMWSSLTDGSAAVLLGTASGLKKLKGENKAIRVDSCVLATSKPHDWDDLENHVVSLAASRAYARAGIGPEDIDIAEVHDSTSFAELYMTELLGFCELGHGGQFAESGATKLNGRLPVNTSGGLESKGHPIGATGLGQTYELVTQLRKKAGPRQVDFANVAVAENGGGLLGIEEAVAVVTVLSR